MISNSDMVRATSINSRVCAKSVYRIMYYIMISLINLLHRWTVFLDSVIEQDA